jgi:hypothetical protein
MVEDGLASGTGQLHDERVELKQLDAVAVDLTLLCNRPGN